MASRWINSIKHPKRAIEILRCIARIENWLELTLHYLGLRHKYPVRLRTRGGIVADLETFHDLVTAWIIFCRGEYHVPRDAELIVDIGANIGLFSLFAAQAAPRTQIVAIEPFPACFERLVTAVTENHLNERVACWRLGVAVEAGARFMPESGVPQSRGLLPAGTEASNGMVKVEVTTLKILLAQAQSHAGDRPIDFLKIDVEGAEHEILTGLAPGSLDGVKKLGIEYHPNGDKQALFSAITKQGLTCIDDKPFGANVGVAHFCRLIRNTSQ